MRHKLLVSLAVLTSLGAATHAQAQSDRDAVVGAIEGFLNAMRQKDTVTMAQYTDSLTRMTLLRPGPNGTRIVALRGSDFLRVAANPNQPAIDEPIRNPVVQIDGDLASVWAEYQVRRDGKVTHCGYDAFHLARLAGKWKIINVSDTYRQTGCGEPWPTAPR
jgi:hypothetical protein